MRFSGESGSVHRPVILVLLLALTVAAGGVLYLRGDLNQVICGGACGPEWTIPPVGLGEASAEKSVVDTVGSAPVDADALTTAVAGPMDAEALGAGAAVVAIDARTGQVLVTDGDKAHVPASTTKLLTGFAALETLGPRTRFTTRVVRQGDRVILVGGGDPDLAVSGLRKLATAAAKTLGTTVVTLGYDDSLFTGPAASPTWEASYVSGGVVAPVSALWVDHGKVGAGRSTTPAADAAARFAALLADRGVTIDGSPRRVEAKDGATELASLRSAPLSRIVSSLLRTSNNESAEVVLRQTALGAGKPASFSGGVAAVEAALGRADVDTSGLVLHDGSGLSRDNRISAATLAETVVASTTSADTVAVLDGLPVGGLTGTLGSRITGDARGWVRAKTGTLTGVHSLAGLATLSGGRPVAFAVMADRTSSINPLETQAAIDRVATAIAQCGC